jgi:DNA helicase-2/ATP-dependent DNA helicase PcrA
MSIGRSADLAGLNPEQHDAVTHLGGPLLVLAGAGSGKTRVITFRVSHLINLGIAPEHIVALSFTNKAAGEMRGRVAKMAGRDIAGRAWLSTFHSMGAQILRRHIQHLGFSRPYTILDTADQLRVIKDVIAELAQGKRHFRELDPKRIQSIISRAKNEFCEPMDLQSLRFDTFRPFAQTVFQRYVEACKALNGVDFDDLITLPVKLMEEVEEVRESLREKCRFVMVDEYQDTNATQLRLLKLLVAPENHICAVGDDDQSIYAFRGATAENILEFRKDFPGAKLVKLEQNYRSTSSILDAANAVIAHNRKRHPKALWSSLGAGSPPRFLQLPTDSDEADFVVDDIRRKQIARDGKWSDFAILFRTSGQARPFEEALREHWVPYRLVGGTEFFDRREIKDVLAYLRLLLNPRDEVALRRIINVPRRGIGPRSLGALTNFARSRGIPLTKAIPRAAEIEGISKGQETALLALQSLLAQAREDLRKMPLEHATRALLQALQFETWLANQKESEKVLQIRIENIREIVTSLGAFERRPGQPGGWKTLEAYLARLTLDGSLATPTETPNKTVGEVMLLTLHGSKGLEFPDVYLVGFEERLLPHARSLQPGGDGDLEEERRLTYVGMTRAKRELVITAARIRGAGGRRRECHPSRFLKEIPQDLLNAAEEVAEESAQESRKEHMAKLRAVLFDD